MPRIIILSNPRSGSTYLCHLLNCHPEFNNARELLNDEDDIQEDPVAFVKRKLSNYSEKYVCFKVFPEQIYSQDLDFGSLVREVGATHVIVLWREGMLETFASMRIAQQTGIWLSEVVPRIVEKTEVKAGQLSQYVNRTIRDWRKIGGQWPEGVEPIFLKFEDLISNPEGHMYDLLSRVGCPCPTGNLIFETKIRRQNPASLVEKVSNFNDLCEDLREKKLNVKEILEAKIASRLNGC